MYYQQANAILNGSYINYAPNGYPFIISIVVKLLGKNSLVTILLWFNIIVGTISIYYVYNISRKLIKDDWSALIAAAIMCVYPNQLNYTRWLLTEVPSTFFILAAYNYYVENKKWLSGIFFGISSVMRPTLFPIWIAIIIFDGITKKRFPVKILIGGAIITLSVSAYSYVKTGEFAIAGNSKINIIYSIYTFGGHIAWDAPEKHPEIKTSRDAKKEYINKAIEHPVYFIEQRLASLWQLWGPFPSTLDGSRRLISRIIIGLENVFLIITGIYGFIAYSNKKEIIILTLPVIIITGIHTMMLSISRYTVPMEPFLIIFSGYAIKKIINRFYIHERI
ncbi:MAG: glycosyltransferase family 39 protein [Thermoflavifilum sp.]|nr:glycosyltransferase family 39 protein [Thermoflavifilum sp.]